MSLIFRYYAECRYAECRYAECRYAECRYAKRHYAECRYAECRYAECRYAECRGAIFSLACSALVPRFCFSLKHGEMKKLGRDKI